MGVSSHEQKLFGVKITKTGKRCRICGFALTVEELERRVCEPCWKEINDESTSSQE